MKIYLNKNYDEIIQSFKEFMKDIETQGVSICRDITSCIIDGNISGKISQAEGDKLRAVRRFCFEVMVRGETLEWSANAEKSLNLLLQWLEGLEQAYCRPAPTINGRCPCSEGVCLDNLGKVFGLKRQHHEDGSIESDEDFRERCRSALDEE